MEDRSDKALLAAAASRDCRDVLLALLFCWELLLLAALAAVAVVVVVEDDGPIIPGRVRVPLLSAARGLPWLTQRGISARTMIVASE